MADKTIMLVCAAGMSTSLLVTKMQEAAVEENKDYHIFAGSVSSLTDVLEKDKIDVVLIGPQVRFNEKKIKEQLAPHNIPSGVIDMRNYGTMNGYNVLKYAEELLG